MTPHSFSKKCGISKYHYFWLSPHTKILITCKTCKTNSSSLSPKLKTWNLLFPSIIQVLLNLFPLESLSHQTLPFFPSLPSPSQCTTPGSLHAGGLGPMTLPFALFKPCCTTAFEAQPRLYIKLSSSFLLFDVGFSCPICVTFRGFHPTSLIITSKLL